MNGLSDYIHPENHSLIAIELTVLDILLPLDSILMDAKDLRYVADLRDV